MPDIDEPVSTPIEELVTAHAELCARRDRLDAERRAIGIRIEAVTGAIYSRSGKSLAETGRALGVSYETVRRRVARLEGRVRDGRVPPTWRGGRTPRQISTQAEGAEALAGGESDG